MFSIFILHIAKYVLPLGYGRHCRSDPLSSIYWLLEGISQDLDPMWVKIVSASAGLLSSLIPSVPNSAGGICFCLLSAVKDYFLCVAHLRYIKHLSAPTLHFVSHHKQVLKLYFAFDISFPLVNPLQELTLLINICSITRSVDSPLQNLSVLLTTWYPFLNWWNTSGWFFLAWTYC